MKCKSGFTYIEVLVALAIGLTVYLSFSFGLTLLLKARDENQVKQDLSTTATFIMNIFSQTGQTADRLDVAGSNELSVTGNPCRLFRYDNQMKNLSYGQDTSSGCSPPTVTTINLNPSQVKVSQFEFLGLPQADDAKSVRLSFTLSSSRPFGSDSASFTTSISLWSK